MKTKNTEKKEQKFCVHENLNVIFQNKLCKQEFERERERERDLWAKKRFA